MQNHRMGCDQSQEKSHSLQRAFGPLSLKANTDSAFTAIETKLPLVIQQDSHVSPSRILLNENIIWGIHNDSNNDNHLLSVACGSGIVLRAIYIIENHFTFMATP